MNYLLIGNTRLHWAKTHNDDYQFRHSPINHTIPSNIDMSNLIWASVGNSAFNTLKVKNEIKTKDIKLDNLPSYFGVDRALGCFAALKVVKNDSNKDLVIADFGTTLSITKLSSKGSIIGGQLLPGFTTQLKAMEDYTEYLKFPNKTTIPKKKFLLETQEAMLKGVFNGLKGAINESYNDKADILIICGGDAKLFGDNFKSEIKNIIIEPNLVMMGMIKLNKILK